MAMIPVTILSLHTLDIEPTLQGPQVSENRGCHSLGKRQTGVALHDSQNIHERV